VTPPGDAPTSDIDPSFRDSSLPIEDRVERLLAQMTVPEKAGLFFHSMISIGPDGELGEGNPAFGIPSPDDLVAGRQINHFNLLGPLLDPTVAAGWHNKLQELAASTRLGIPVTLSTDPRHSFTDNPGAAFNAAAFSEWPETMGLAAIGDEALVERFADIARREYVAVGLRCALHPQVDLATEPRWARQFATFGEDVELTSRLGAAYIRGFQGNHVEGGDFGPGSVSTMTKHFPGGGPQADGEDPHFAYGREQVYPGGQFELHLKPFEAAMAAGARQMMPYYGMPVGTEYEEVGFGFNKGVITGLLRERYGYEGIVCTDWGLITGHVIIDAFHPARAWGVEHLSERERMIKCLEAGVDQFGGEYGADLLVEIIESGDVSAERIDVSVRRLLREKFALGLFDEPYVDASRAASLVGTDEFRAAGDAAQRASLTLLTNGENDGASTLPLGNGLSLYVEGIDASVAATYGTVVSSPSEADVAILRLKAPYETRKTAFENFFHAGSLDFDAEAIAHVLDVAAEAPTVLDVFCDRPAILTPFVDTAAAIVVNYGASARALLDVLFGAAEPRGSLPFDLPSSMVAVEASRPDVPFDTADPLFRFGHGLHYRH
jgi:beta-glucosidase